MFARKKPIYEPAVGKTFWITGHVDVCPEPNALSPRCARILAPRRLVVDRVVQGFLRSANDSRPLTESDPYCHVTFSDGVSGYVACQTLMRETLDVDPTAAAAECKRHGGRPRVGQSAKIVEYCWGKPNNVKSAETASGVTEKYIYDQGRYVLFHDGVAVKIRTERW